MKDMGMSGVIRKYLPRIGKPQEEGGITKAQYDKLLEVVTGVVVTETLRLAPCALETVEDTDKPESSRAQHLADSQEARGARDGLTSAGYEELESHPAKASGKSQKAKLLALLQDGNWHDSVEIMDRVYRVGENRGNCRIPSRICELRQAGNHIETKRVTQTLTAYRLLR